MNLKRTLLFTSLTIAEIENRPPDFRCFPFKGIHIRQRSFPNGADFTGATLANAEIWGGSVTQADFSDANLYGAKIKYLDVTGSTFKGALLTNTNFGPRITELTPEMFQKTNWKMARFASTEIPGHIESRFPNSGGEWRGRDRDLLCSDILAEFEQEARQ